MNNLTTTAKSYTLSTSVKGILTGSLSVLLLYRIILDTGYVFFVSKHYDYDGFELVTGAVKIIESYLGLILVYFFLPKDQSRVSHLVLQLLMLMAFVPITSFYALGDAGRFWFYTVECFFLAMLAVHQFIPDLKIPRPKVLQPGLGKLSLIMLLIPIVALALLMPYPGLEFSTSLTDVYDVRETFSEIKSQIPLGGYIYHWIGRVILPFLLLIGLFAYKKPSILFVGITGVLLLLLFSVSGHKSFAFRPVLAIAIALMIPRKRVFKELSAFLIVAICGALFLYILTGDLMPGSLAIRRALLLPAQISWYYYDFFNTDYLYLSHSLLEGITEYPYDEAHPMIISTTYLGEESHANNGIFSDGFKNFGILGVFVWAAATAFLLKVADAVAAGKNKMVTWTTLVIAFYTLINGALLTSILTHGILIALILVYLYPTETNSSRE